MIDSFYHPLQAVQILCRHLLSPDHALDVDFGARLGAVIALIVLTGLFCILFWLLKIIRHDKYVDGLSDQKS